MKRWAVILDISKEVPTYHAFGRDDLTVCGRRISPKRVGIPARHAVKFAKECRGCFSRG
jgi:hypothetical protein